MRRGFTISSVVMVFAFAVIVSLFMFVLAENELHNSAMTGLTVEKARWISDAADYYCQKDANTPADWEDNDYAIFSAMGVNYYTGNFSDGYFRGGDRSSFFTTLLSIPELDFFERDRGFNISYIRNNPPHAFFESPRASDAIDVNNIDGSYNFTFDVCDSETLLVTDLVFNITYSDSGAGGPWTEVPNEDDSGTIGDETLPDNDQYFTANLTSLIAPAGPFCFKIEVEDDDGADNTAEDTTVCDVTVS